MPPTDNVRPDAEPEAREVPDRTGKWTFTSGMGEISGFGGGYEQTCRNMLAAALDWFEAHPDADPQFHGYKGIYGVITEDNADAKALTKAIIDAADNDATGAMHHAVVTHALKIRERGWDWYVAEMSKPCKDEDDG